VTDENAFSALKNKGINIFVGNPKKTQANYYLKNTIEIKTLLKRIDCLI
jgi:predicted Fe-Mo cluster-binding NifX family protein